MRTAPWPDAFGRARLPISARTDVPALCLLLRADQEEADLRRTRAAGRERTLKNFGGNQTWAARCYRPQESANRRYSGAQSPGQVRPLGSGHSWSDVVVSSDVALDMSALAEVRTFERDGETFAEVGAGCRLQDLLDRLHATTDRTLPTLGAIKRQTISGAISTGTHGSGKPGLSHL